MNVIKGMLLMIVLTAQVAKAQDTNTTNVADAKTGIVNHYTKAYILSMKYGDYDQAINAVYNVLAEYPTNDSLMYSLSYLYFQANKIPAAVLTSQDLLKANPDHLGALEISGAGYETLGLKEKSLAAYETLYLKTGDYQTLYKVAFLQYELQRYNECNTNLDILLSKEEANTAKIYYAEKDNQQNEYSIKVSLLNLKGLLSKANGDKVNARKYFEQALDVAPNFALAKQNIESLDE